MKKTTVYAVAFAVAALAPLGAEGLKSDLAETVETLAALTETAAQYPKHTAALEAAYAGLRLKGQVKGVKVKNVTETSITVSWKALKGKDAAGLTGYRVYWADKNLPTTVYSALADVGADETSWTWQHKSLRPFYFKVSARYENGAESELSDAAESAVKARERYRLEKLDRGLVGFKTESGVFLSWRLLASEVTGYGDSGLTGTNFAVYRGSTLLATVTDSTNYLDRTGSIAETYSVIALDARGKEIPASKASYKISTEKNYIDIPLQIPPVEALPADAVIKSQLTYDYAPEDIAIGDADGDGQYEYYVRWFPSNFRDVSGRGYTGKTYFDCYKLDGTLLWRIDMGWNLRSGAHYNNFAVADVNGDGRSEIALITAPGTKITVYAPDGSVKDERYITLPQKDVEAGVSHSDDYRVNGEGYKAYFTREIQHWGDWEHPFWRTQSSEETFANATRTRAKWDKNIENLWDFMYAEQGKAAPPQKVGHDGPYTEAEAETLSRRFFGEVAPYKEKWRNDFSNYEGFVLTGPQYITVFAGDGSELDTQELRYPREDSGLLWGDYQWPRIEPMNRNERHNMGTAYLDGEKPYFIFCNGYYTRATAAAYTLGADNKILRYWGIDSGWVEMPNPFFITSKADMESGEGNIPEAAGFAAQGDHSISIADVDGDGCQEIIYGGAIIDNDGTLYSSAYALRPDGVYSKFGHGDSQHVTDIDPDHPGLEIFACYEDADRAPYGTALRDAMSRKTQVLFGDYSGDDTGRCLIGDILPAERGLETWGYINRTAKGKEFTGTTIGTNQNIRWAADMSTSVYTNNIVGLDAKGKAVVQLDALASGTKTAHGTKGTAGLVADVLGDWREELIVQSKNHKSLHVYSNTEVTHHKLYTLAQNPQYRSQVSAQQSAYNQPSYPDFYLATDTDWQYVWVPNKPHTALRDNRTKKPKAAKAGRKQLPAFPAQQATAALTEADARALEETITALGYGAKIKADDSLDAATAGRLEQAVALLERVQKSALCDLSAASDFFVKAHVLDAADYSAASYNVLAEAMEQAAKDAAVFARSPETLGALKAKLSSHLAGAAESGADYFALYLDFGAKGAESAHGYTAVYGDDESALYTKARGWGLEKKSAARNRGPGDGAYMNFVLDNTVIVDLPAAGTYALLAVYGDAIAGNSTSATVTVDGEKAASFGGKTEQGEFNTNAVLVTADSAATLRVQFKGRLNALRLEQVVPVK